MSYRAAIVQTSDIWLPKDLRFFLPPDHQITGVSEPNTPCNGTVYRRFLIEGPLLPWIEDDEIPPTVRIGYNMPPPAKGRTFTLLAGFELEAGKTRVEWKIGVWPSVEEYLTEMRKTMPAALPTFTLGESPMTDLFLTAHQARIKAAVTVAVEANAQRNPRAIAPSS